MTSKKLNVFATATVIACMAMSLTQCTTDRTDGPSTIGKLFDGILGGGSDDGDDDPALTNVVNVSGNLAAFGSDEAFRAFIERTEHKMVERARAIERRRSRDPGGMLAEASSAPSEEAAEAESSADSADESVTNNQEQGVDEGGIVKVHGDHLVVLRRGRLFTAEIGDDQLRPISMVDVTPPGGGADGWYDEMLISEDTIVVVGFSYGAGATELGLFDIDDEGVVRHRATHYLRSNDYYSSRNYASRLIGDQLIFYMPYFMFTQGWEDGETTFTSSLPSVATHGRTGVGDWSEIVDAQRIYRPVQETPMPVLHTVVQCDLASPTFACEATSIVGPPGRNFYVARDAVYVWVSPGYYGSSSATPEGEPVTERAPAAAVYRLPLDGSRPGARRVWGNPVDQFSFKEKDGHLNVLVRADGGGDMMWAPEDSAGAVGLLRLPVEEFARTRVDPVDRSRYATLEAPASGYSFQNRFVGDYVLYGTGSSWGWHDRSADPHVFAYAYERGGSVAKLALPHGVDRIEALGSNAVIVGTDGRNLHFSAVDLGASPRLRGRYTQRSASQGETRSHGFFFKARGDGSGGGTLGLPIRGGGAPGWMHLARNSAAILYLDVDDLEFDRVGALTARSGQINDRCVASCVDWYGNARPLFLRGRVFALLGYELVEGRVDGGEMSERRRVHLYRGAQQR